MNVYIFRAALYCADCGRDHRESVDIPAGADLDNESTFDSDDYPKGPYGNGGGESDSPQHCDDCGTFLDNPLTDDGRAYVREALERGTAPAAWRDAYWQELGLDCPEPVTC